MTRTLILGLLAFFLLCALCISCHAPQVVEKRAKAAFEAAGLDPNYVAGSGHFSWSGLDLDLEGVADSEEDRARAGSLAAGIAGVREVRNRLTLRGAGASSEGPAAAPPGTAGEAAAQAPAGAASGPLSFAAEEANLELGGSVPSQDFRTTLKAAAVALWGEGSVVDELFLDADADTACWPDSFAAFLEALKSRGRGVKVSLADCTLRIEGEVLSELEGQRLLGSFRSALPGFEVEDRLLVRPAATEAEKVQASLDQLLTTEIVEFESNSDQLTPRGREVLDRIAGILSGSAARLQISGHTDSSGDAAYNLDLSQRRAETVRSYLVARGLSAERFSAVGYGESQPIADNSTEEGKRKNRRTEFRALAGERE